MSAKILMVDDEPNVLEGYRRQLRNCFDVDTVLSGDEGLSALDKGGPYAVVVSDMRMPIMDGIEFLKRVREQAPETVRIMLTGNSDQQTAVDAVNEGAIFRFLSKPCETAFLQKVLQAGLDQYRLITAERQLLSQTLTASVQILTEVLSIANPSAFGRANRVRPLVRRIAEYLQVESPWQSDVAAMLSQVGCVQLPTETLEKIARGRGERLSPTEEFAWKTHPEVGRRLIAKVPRLGNVADIVYYQQKRFDGSGFPEDGKQGEDIPIGARILKVAFDYDSLVVRPCSSRWALEEMETRKGFYDLRVIEALRHVLDKEAHRIEKSMLLRELPIGATIVDPVISQEGGVLMGKGEQLTESARLRLISHAATVGVHEPLMVSVPVQ